MILERLKNLDKIIFTYRGAIPLPFFIIALFYLRDKFVIESGAVDKLIALSGLALILIGELIRALAIAVGSRGTGSGGSEVKARRLLVSGVYAYTRNPRYLGNFFICMGLAVIFSNLYLVLVTFFGFWLITYAVVTYEERFLRETFGEEYDRYRQTIPRFFPTFKSNPYKTIPREKWSWGRFFKKEQDTYSIVLLLWCVLELVKETQIKGVFDAWSYAICVFSVLVIMQWIILKAWKKGWIATLPLTNN